MSKRVFLLVLDSVGIGHAPDAAAFGDEGAHTLRSVSRSPAFSIPTLLRLGIAAIEGSDLPQSGAPTALVARLQEHSRGKDTVTGHWELAGLVSDTPFPTYPNGFPAALLEAFSAQTGRGVLCNRPYSGTQVIADHGEQHLATGDLIVYTSADSVFQIAAHEAVVPPEQLYDYCRIARRLLDGEHRVGRVIARPFIGDALSGFVRTDRRRDFAVPPPAPTVLDEIKAAGLDCIAVGKIRDIFDGRGITRAIPTHGNDDGMAQTAALAAEEFAGLCFVNLVDFDMLYGHRNDVDGYAAALSYFDSRLPELLSTLREDDVLMITADHGCDPGFSGSDHTREYTPILVYGDTVKAGVNLGTRKTFADIAATLAEIFSVDFETRGESFLEEII